MVVFVNKIISTSRLQCLARLSPINVSHCKTNIERTVLLIIETQRMRKDDGKRLSIPFIFHYKEIFTLISKPKLS